MFKIPEEIETTSIRHIISTLTLIGSSDNWILWVQGKFRIKEEEVKMFRKTALESQKKRRGFERIKTQSALGEINKR